jgi:hypothetical protein
MATITGSRGRLRGQVFGSCDDYGIDEGSVSIIIRTFMAIRNDLAIHWIDLTAGVLLFAQAQPNDPCSGVIYVYDKRARAFWGLDFEEGGDTLTRKDFEALIDEYRLNDYAARPVLLEGLATVTRA